MSQTAQQLISSSLRMIGVLAAGEAASSDEANDALTVLNQLIDSWSNEQLLIPNKVREVFPFVAGQQTYTMGSGGNFNTVRAQKIENALFQLAQTSPVLEMPMVILTKEQYQAILLKTLTSTYPLYMYNDGAYPLDSLKFWPVPSSAVNNVVLYSWKPLTTLATLATTLSLPPGYERAIRFALAIDLAPEYGKGISPEIVAIAIESKAAIKRMNYRPNFLQVDEAIRAEPAIWNWLTGDPL